MFKRRLAVVWLSLALLITATWVSAVSVAEETSELDLFLHVIPEPLEWFGEWEKLLPNIFYIAEYRLEKESADGTGDIAYGFRLDRFDLSGQSSLELYTGHFPLSSAYFNEVQRFRLVISAAKDTPEATVHGELERLTQYSRTGQRFQTVPQQFTAHLERVLAHDRLKSPLTVTRPGAHYTVAYWAVPESGYYSTSINLSEGYTAEELVEALRAQNYGTVYVLSIVPNI